MLQASSKPIIYYGGGCLDARDELREFARKTGIPYTATLMGLGTLPTEHDQVRLGHEAECMHRLSHEWTAARRSRLAQARGPTSCQ